MNTENKPVAINLTRARKAVEIFGRTPPDQLSMELCSMLGECLGAALVEIERLRSFEGEVELETIAWLDTSAATAGLTPTERVLHAVKELKAEVLQRRAAGQG